jgi:hypothetical protein
MPTMNIPDLSPSSFHDANLRICPLAVGESGATPTSAADSTAVEKTPIQQRRLFAKAIGVVKTTTTKKMRTITTKAVHGSLAEFKISRRS